MKPGILTGLLLSMIAIAAAMAFPQSPGMHPWWDGPVAKDLGLSDDQTQQIRATVRESRNLMIQFRAAVETAEGELKDEMNNVPVDLGKANDAIEKVIRARSDLMRAVSQMSLKLRTILTASQWQELQRREPQRSMPGMQRYGAGRQGRRAPPAPQ